jgi:RNA polymerase sigma-70 factor (ECF subfamily)
MNMFKKEEEKWLNKLSKDEFADLVIKNQTSMYRLAMSILKNTTDAEDAVSESILIAYKHLSSLKKPDSFKAWIMTILSNVSKTMLKNREKIDLYKEPDLFEKTAKEDSNEIWQLVLTLSEEYSQVVILYYYEGFTTKEISKILHIPEGTVKSRLSRARNKLQQLI